MDMTKRDASQSYLKLEKIKNLHVIGLHDMQTNHIFLIFLQIKYECTLRVTVRIPVGKHFLYQK